MKLLIISNMSHHRRGDGRIVGHGATVRELDHLATLFEEVRHVGCLFDDAAPGSELPYTRDRVELIPLAPSGGETVAAKLDILTHAPGYVRTIRAHLPWADVVHVRCPANVSLFAVALLPTVRRLQRRWVKYAGSWQAYPGESRPTALQRAMLRGTWHGAQVTINGAWPSQPPHVHTFDNPCLTDDEIVAGAHATQTKQLTLPLRLIFVGGLEPAKGADIAIDALLVVRAHGVDATLDIIGDGTQREALEERARPASQHIHFHGWVPRPQLAGPYARAHMILLPSRTEGWPKVLAEAMAYGVVPIASAVGSIPQILGELESGVALASCDAESFGAAVIGYAADPTRWAQQARAGARGISRFGYTRYLERVRMLLDV